MANDPFDEYKPSIPQALSDFVSEHLSSLPSFLMWLTGHTHWIAWTLALGIPAFYVIVESLRCVFYRSCSRRFTLVFHLLIWFSLLGTVHVLQSADSLEQNSKYAFMLIRSGIIGGIIMLPVGIAIAELFKWIESWFHRESTTCSST